MPTLAGIAQEVVKCLEANQIDFNLLVDATSDDLTETTRLLQLIHDRGYSRDKELLADFALLQESIL
ncbi:MAG: hypothetical protein KF851_15505 [Pirellulaceae bacterium]|nr:hypothetical protein [Pirellulaceae bacterium]